jgi:hypothetical protein
MFHCLIQSNIFGTLHILIKNNLGIYVNKIAKLVGQLSGKVVWRSGLWKKQP